MHLHNAYGHCLWLRAGVLIGTHAHEVMSIMQHLLSSYDYEAGDEGHPVQVELQPSSY